jgi:hypothetical protein
MLDVDSSQRTLSEREFRGYAVFLPPRGSRDAARRLTDELLEKGISDYYIMTDGELRNAVSLGLFRERKHADGLVARVRRLGFQPELETRYRDLALIWLDYEDADGVIDQALIRDLSPQDAVQRLDRDC